MRGIICTLLLFNSLISISQSMLNNVYFDLSGGARFLGNTSSSTNAAPGLHLDLGIGYQLNENFAIKGDLAIDQYIAKDTSSNAVFNYDSGIKYTYLYDKSTLLRVSINGVINIGDIAGFASEKFGMKAQVGVGFASNYNRDYRTNHSGSFSDPGIKGNDDMICANLVITPQYLLNDRVSLNGNIGYAFLSKQSHYIDRMIDGTLIDGSDMLLCVSIGISAKLSK